MFVLRAAFPFFHLKIKERRCRFNSAADENFMLKLLRLLRALVAYRREYSSAPPRKFRGCSAIYRRFASLRYPRKLLETATKSRQNPATAAKLNRNFSAFLPFMLPHLDTKAREGDQHETHVI
jgi:hypothetical protein